MHELIAIYRILPNKFEKNSQLLYYYNNGGWAIHTKTDL